MTRVRSATAATATAKSGERATRERSEARAHVRSNVRCCGARECSECSVRTESGVERQNRVKTAVDFRGLTRSNIAVPLLWLCGTEAESDGP